MPELCEVITKNVIYEAGHLGPVKAIIMSVTDTRVAFLQYTDKNGIVHQPRDAKYGFEQGNWHYDNEAPVEEPAVKDLPAVQAADDEIRGFLAKKYGPMAAEQMMRAQKTQELMVKPQPLVAPLPSIAPTVDEIAEQIKTEDLMSKSKYIKVARKKKSGRTMQLVIRSDRFNANTDRFVGVSETAPGKHAKKEKKNEEKQEPVTETAPEEVKTL